MKMHKIILITISIGVLVLFGSVVWIFWGSDLPQATLEEVAVLVNEEAVTSTNTNEEASPKSIEEIYAEIAETEGSKEALRQLGEEPEGNTEVLEQCENIAWQMGTKDVQNGKAWEEIVTIATAQPICKAGYLYGAMFAEVETLGVEGVGGLCQSFDQGSFLHVQCYRALGQMIQRELTGEPADALAICDSLVDQTGKYNCSNGVFSEYFNPEFVSPEHRFGFDVCDEQEDPGYLTSCYLHIAKGQLLTNEGFASVMDWCDGASEGNVTMCASGLGYWATAWNFPRLADGEVACQTEDENKQQACISGLSFYLLDFYGAFEPVQRHCGTLQPENIDTCYAIVGESNI